MPRYPWDNDGIIPGDGRSGKPPPPALPPASEPPSGYVPGPPSPENYGPGPYAPQPTIHVKVGGGWKSKLVTFVAILVVLAMVWVAIGHFIPRWSPFHLLSPVSPAATKVVDLGPLERTKLEAIKDPAPAVASYHGIIQITKSRQVGWLIHWTIGYSVDYNIDGTAEGRLQLDLGDYWKLHPQGFRLVQNTQPTAGHNGTATAYITLPGALLPRSINDVALIFGTQPGVVTSGQKPTTDHYIGCAFGKGCPAAYLLQVHFTEAQAAAVAEEKLVCKAGVDQALAALTVKEGEQTISGWLSALSSRYGYDLTVVYTVVPAHQPPLPSFCSQFSGNNYNFP